jgi:hypothetical protein
MLLGIIFIALCTAVGWQVVRLLPITAHKLEAAAMSVTIGLNLGSWIAFLFGLIFGFPIGLIIAFTVLLASQLAYLWIKGRILLISTRYHSRWRIPALFTSAFITIFILNITYATFQIPGPNGDWVLGGFSSGDFALHSALAGQFAHGNTVDLVSPVYLRTKLVYPFIPDFLSGMMLRLGSSWLDAFVLPTLLMMTALMQLIWSFGYRLTRSVGAAWLSFLIFIFSGSATGGIIAIYKLLCRTPGFIPSVAFEPIFNSGERYFNFILEEALPQHAYLFGLPMLICILIICLELYRESIRPHLAKTTGLATGVLIGLMPLIHTHSFLVAIGLISLGTVFILVRRRRLPAGWIYTIVTAVLIALPQLYWQFHNSFGSHFIRLIFGWKLLYLQESPPINWFIHWGSQLGFILIFMLIGWYWLRRYIATAEIWFFYWSGMGVFALSNLIIFQPSYYDNMKFFMYATWLLSLPIAFVLRQWWRTMPGRIATSLLIVNLTLTGVISIFLIAPFMYTDYLSKNDIILAAKMDHDLPRDAYFLTSSTSSAPITLMANRKDMIHTDDWVNLYDERASTIIRDRDIMMHGGDQARSLMKLYGVNYASINYADIEQRSANLQFFQNNFKLVAQNEHYWIFDLNTQPAN